MSDMTPQPSWWERSVTRVFDLAGLSVQRKSSVGQQLPVEATAEEKSVISSVSGFTMTSPTRIWSLLRAVEYIHAWNVPGAVVECGVWRGGSMMAAALQLQTLGAYDRELWLYDTFTGMTEPTDEDREAATGVTAQELLASTPIADGDNVWCLASENDVWANMNSTGYPTDLLNFVKGDVSATLKQRAPEHVALLRLDTDWYASTKVELEVLYERLIPGGICILDDYGHWEGARKAVDDFFVDHPPRPFMMPIDYSGRVFVKPR